MAPSDKNRDEETNAYENRSAMEVESVQAESPEEQADPPEEQGIPPEGESAPAEKAKQPSPSQDTGANDILQSLQNDFKRSQAEPIYLQKRNLIIFGAAVGLILFILLIGSCPKKGAPEAVKVDPKIEKLQNIQQKHLSRKDLEGQIGAIMADLEKLHDELYAESLALEDDLALFAEIPNSQIVWYSREFFAKEKVKRKTKVTYTDYSDPKNPVEKQVAISFTVDHGKLLSIPEKVLLAKELPEDLIISAVAGTPTGRIKPEGYQVIIELKSISAELAKARLLKKKEELKTAKTVKDIQYQREAAEAEKKIKDLESELKQLGFSAGPQG